MAQTLYTPAVLALATDLSQWPPAPDLPLHGNARSAACGSTLALDLATDVNGRITALGVTPRACAIGQAAAAIFAAAATGRDRADLIAARGAIGTWLAAEGPLPAWPGLDALADVPAYPGRHGAVLLAWNAAIDALPSTGRPG